MAKKFFLFGFIAVLLALLLLSNFSMSATGTENITLTRYASNVSPGGNLSVNYTLSLVNGYYTSGTTMVVLNNRQLVAENISVLLTNQFGNPPLKGTMHIFLPYSLAASQYHVTLNGTSQGIAINGAQFNFNVTSQSSTTTTSIISTTVSQTIISTILTTASSTLPTTTIVASTNSSANGTFALLVLIIVILLVVIVLMYIMMRKKGGMEKHHHNKNPKETKETET